MLETAESNGLYVEGEFDGVGRLLFFGDRAFLKGWAFASGDQGAELVVMYGGRQLATITPTEDRPDVVSVYADAPLRSGFTIELLISAIPEQSREGATLTLLLRRSGSVLRKSELVLALGAPRAELHVDATSRDGAHIVVSTSNTNLVGWCVAQDEIVAIIAEIGSDVALPVHYGISRPDVFAIRPMNPNGKNTGFSLFIPDLPEGDSDLTLRIATRSQYTITKKFALRALPAYDTTFPRTRSRSEALFWQLAAKGACTDAWAAVILPPSSDSAAIDRELEVTLSSIALACSTMKVLVPAELSAPTASNNIEQYASFEDLHRQLLEKYADSFVSFLEPGDVLDAAAPDILASTVRPHIDFVYWDENAVVGGGRSIVRKTPGAPFVTEFHLNTIGRGWASRVTKGFLNTLFEAQASAVGIHPLYSFYACPERCVHVPEVLSTHTYVRPAGDMGEIDLAARSQLLGLVGTRYARFVDLATFETGGDQSQRLQIRLPENCVPLVSIIIPTCGAGRRVIKCLRDIREKSSYRAVEVIVLDDTPSREENAALRKEIRELADIVIPVGGPFNWSRFNNMGAALSSGDVLLFLNDDVEVVTQDWLEQLVCYLNFEQIGAIGPRLLFPVGDCVQSAGVSLLTSAGWARNDFAFGEKNRSFAGGVNLVPRNCSSLLGAAIAVRRELFMRAGGFEERLALTFNDLDFCLRLRKLGYQVVCTPFAELIHHEKNSRAELVESEMEETYWARWADAHATGDPYWHPAVEHETGLYKLDPEPVEPVWRGSSAGTRGQIRRVLVLRLDHLGDFVQTMPAFHQLRRAFPDAVIEIVVGKWNADLAKRSGLFHVVHELDFYKQRSGDGRAASIADAVSALAEIGSGAPFDLAIDMRADGDTRALLQNLNARYKAGFSHGARYAWLDISIEWEGNLPQWRKNANGSVLLSRLIAAIEDAFPQSDIDTPVWQNLSQSHGEDSDKSRLRPVVAMHPFAGNEIKMWPAKYWVALTRIIVRSGGRPALIGTTADRTSYEDLVNAMKSAGAEDLTGRFGIPDLLNYLAGVQCFVGCDSGPKHLAASVRVPTIGIQSGFVDPIVWAPACNQGVSVVKRVACAPCYLDEIEKCTRGHKCMRDISPAAVFRYVSIVTGLPQIAGRTGSDPFPHAHTTQMPHLQSGAMRSLDTEPLVDGEPNATETLCLI